MRTRVYFVRHAEAESNANPDFEGGVDNLTDIGLKQAQSLALRFRDIKIDAVYTSNILRAELTAKEIGKVTGLVPQILPYIKEIKGSFPDKFLYQQLPKEEMKGVIRKIVHNTTWDPSMDETFESFKSRIIDLKSFLESLTYRHVIVVSHARFIKAFASYILLEENLTEQLSALVSLKITIGNTAVSKFEYNHDKLKWRIETLNDEVHLS